LQAGTLVQVLPDWKLPIIEAHAVFTAGRAANPSARAFANYLADYFRESAAA
jgi:DNA-binding transcriptional LysR family regulator